MIKLPLASLHHLPAYATVGRWVTGRRIVVVGPSGPEGPSRLLASGARRVTLVGECPWAEPGFEVRPGVPGLPLSDDTADVVLCIEPYATYTPTVRRQLVREAHRTLRSGGLFAAWVPRVPAADDDADFWALEAEFAEVFTGATMVAQIPWQGVSLAPVVDDERVPTVALEEALLDEVPEASHYLAIAFRDRSPPELLSSLRSQCLLVPVPDAGTDLERREQRAIELESTPIEPEPVEPNIVAAAVSEPSEPELRLGELEQQLESRDTDIRVLTGNVEALEQSLARVSERAEARALDFEVAHKERRELQERSVALGRERDSIAHQVEIATAERAGARQLSERVEAELEQARRRVAEQSALLAERTAEASRLTGELAAVRERLTHQEAALDQTRTRADELTRSAARQDEQSRMLAEVASDRDRLREELTRRGEAIGALEDRVWSTREDVQKERLEAVRLSSDVERLREQAERAREAETEGRGRVEILSAEIRAAELQRADAVAMLRSREEEIVRLLQDAETLTSESADIAQLRSQLSERGRELGEVQARLERARVRTTEAADAAKRREEQLSKAGEELQTLRHCVEQSDAQASGLQGELDVKLLEVEQLAASVANLQDQLAEQRRSRRDSDDATSDLQRRLELATEELDVMRNRLRERDQELADVVSAGETSGVELYKLRQELETASHVNEQLEEALGHDPGVVIVPGSAAEASWPDDAVSETRRLRGQLAAQTRRHAEQLARIEGEREPIKNEDDLVRRHRAAALEADVRADEQGHLLTLLEASEQRVWEMDDASGRNAARLAASLAQLEKHKEQLDETLDELEVTRNLLTVAQTRALEQERLVASERAKLMRAGIDPDGLPNTETDHEDPFADLESTELMIELHVSNDAHTEAGTPTSTVSDRTGSSSSSSLRLEGPRIVVEAVDDDEWGDDDLSDDDVPGDTATKARRGTGSKSNKGPTGEFKAVGKSPPMAGAPSSVVEDPTMPRLQVPPPPEMSASTSNGSKSSSDADASDGVARSSASKK